MRIASILLISTCIAWAASDAPVRNAISVDKTILTNARTANCATPQTVTSFTVNDPEIWLYASIGNGQRGDVYRTDWINPSGQLARTVNFSGLPDSGDYCFNAPLATATPGYGNPVTLVAGTWNVRGYWNNSQIFSIMFTVTAAGGGGASGGSTNPVAWWKFDEGSGSNVSDSSGNGNMGLTVGAATWGTGKVSNALTFDGVSSYVGGTSTGTGFPLGASARTICAWIRTPGTGADESILHYGTAGNSSPTNFHLFVQSAGGVGIGNGGAGMGTVVTTAKVNDNNWHFVAGVYEGSSTNLARVYIDGVQQTSGTLTNTPNTGGGSLWRIGRFLDPNTGPSFKGSIDELRMYDRALSAAEIQSLTGASTAPPATGKDATLTQGWDDFGQPLTSGKVTWSSAPAAAGSLTFNASFVLTGATPNHLFAAGVHFFEPSGTSQPDITQFGGTNVGAGRSALTREGVNGMLIGAWDFGPLQTDAAGNARADFSYTVPDRSYYMQFTVRIGTCSPSGGSNCIAAYRTGQKYGTNFEVITGSSGSSESSGSSGPVAWWKFDETSGTSAADASGNGNTGLAVGAVTWGTGKVGNALAFDGVSSYVGGTSTGTGFPLGSSARTICAWIRTPGTGSDTSILHYGTAGTTSPTNFHLFVQSTGGVGIGNGGAGMGTVISTAKVNDNNWHFVAGVYEGSSTNLARVYIDGVQQTSGTLANMPNTGGGSLWRIGRFLDPNTGPSFKGSLDELRMYNRALSAAEIQALSGSSTAPPATGRDATLTQGWDDFGQPLTSGKVTWSSAPAAAGSLTFNASFILTGATPNHLFAAGVHFFEPSGTSQPDITQFGGTNVGAGRGALTREGVNAMLIGAWDFGPLQTDAAGNARADFSYTVPDRTYYMQFTVRIGTCSPSGGSGCSAAYRTGQKYGTNFEIITGSSGSSGSSGPVAWWKFDETSGTSAADASGNGNTGTTNGSTPWVAGKVGGAISIDGRSSYVEGANAGRSFPVGNASRTITAWIKNGGSGSDQGILQYGTGVNSTPSNFHLLVRAGGAVAVGNGGSGMGLIVTTPTSSLHVDDNAWHHVAGVYEGASTNMARVYIDGVQQASGTLANVPNTGTGSSWRIGRFLSPDSQPSFNGAIDELRLYDRALSAAEIQALYSQDAGSSGGGGTGPTGCAYDFPATSSVPGGGYNSLLFRVTTAPTCTWTARSDSWITLTAPFTGAATQGSGGVAVSIGPSTVKRSGIITISWPADKPTGSAIHTVSQDAAVPCTYSLTPTSASLPAEGGTGSFNVKTDSSCSWTPVRSDTWITISSPAGSTNGTANVNFTVDANRVTSSRTGSIKAGDQTFNISQAAATPSGPNVSTGGIVNAASNAPGTGANGGVAQGSYISIYGSKLGPDVWVSAPSGGSLNTSLGGVSVKITNGSTVSNVLPTFVAASQINAIVPSDAPLGDGQLTVTYNGVTSPPAAIKIVKYAFGGFTMGSTSTDGIIQNVPPGSREDQRPLNSHGSPAIPGTYWAIVWGTGLGANMQNGRMLPDNQPPPYNPMTLPITVTVGGKNASVQFSGRAPGFGGVDNVYFVVPADAPTGCNIPVVVTVGGVVSNTVTMAIDAKGAACTDPGNPFSIIMQPNYSKIGVVTLFKSTISADLFGSPFSATMDRAMASFVQVKPGTPASPVTNLPALGSCTSLSLDSLLGGSGDLTGAGAGLAGMLVGNSGGTYLDAGKTLSLYKGKKPATGADTRQKIPMAHDPDTPKDLSYSVSGGFGQPVSSFLAADTYQLTNDVAGKDIGLFSVQFDTPAFDFSTNLDSVKSINRSAPYTITWTGGSASQQAVLIAGGNSDPVTKKAVGFECLVPLAAGSFTVPVASLTTVPASPANKPDTVDGLLIVGAIPYGAFPTFSGPGLDMAFVTYGKLVLRTTRFQ